MKAKWSGALLALLAAAAVALPGRAEETKAPSAPCGAGCCGPAAAPAAGKATAAPKVPVQTWEKAVGLTAAQKEQVAKIGRETSSRARAIHARMQEAQAEVDRLMAADPPDLERAKPLIKKAAGCMAEMQVASMETWARISAVLTAEQRAALKEWQAARGGGCGGGKAPAAPVPAASARR